MSTEARTVDDCLLFLRLEVPKAVADDIERIVLGRIADLERELLRARKPIDSYACARCGRADGLDAVASSEVWTVLSERAGSVSILCLWCMDELAAELGISSSLSLHFFGRALSGTSNSDADRDFISRLVKQRDDLERDLAAAQKIVQAHERTSSKAVELADKAVARAERTEGELADVRKHAEHLAREGSRYAAEWRRAEADSLRLREALEKYGGHLLSCFVRVTLYFPAKCDCGFDTARAAEQVPK